ncbi:hypothetical protein Poli38472_000753 [Pythium oligandrum]|uniref:Autophagy-related protein 9 n=2 Tax=Pythium oligandrum TaxID=41045 RepID=A0A8K1CCA4_PYTOL|nr:hypothetical protein Poli38472_000753 [Pythium oligandrum]|eukprot:TMW60711.1 hypothetical protein Poli38472_000753 [Pythium oligandrum]
MDESLLGPKAARLPVAEEDEELWNALKDDHVDHHDDAMNVPLRGGGYAHHDPEEHEAFLSRPGRQPAAQMPSLRAHVHLPAISTLFQNVAESTKSAVASAKNRVGGVHMAGGSQSPPNTPNVRISNAPDDHGRVANVDAFLISLYNYFYHKGFWTIATVEIVSLCTGLFSVTLSSFLLGCVQWHKLLECHDEMDCKQELEHFVTCRADQPGVMHLVVAFYFTMFLFYWIFRAVQLVGTLRDAREMGNFYTQRLNIDERQLQTVTWDEVVTRVLGLINTVSIPSNLRQISSYRLQIDPVLLSTPHDFARRIMRRENYLIAFMNHSLFQGTKILPTWLHFASTTHAMFSINMECNLNICLIDQMFDADQNLSLAVMNDVQMLQKRFMIAGVINLVLTPFILLYRVIRFLSLSAQEWHTNKGLYFGSRRWSAYAQWKFREYNELPHVLEMRMARSYPLAEKYLAMFPAGLVAVVAGGVSFCASSVMAVLIGVSVMEESVLLETTLWDRQLLWYLTIFTGIFALARSFTTQSSPFLLNGDCEEAMLQISAETHHFPKEWRGHCHSYDVRDAFLTLFPYKAVLFAEECLSVILAPYILCVSLPQCARELLLFIRSHSMSIPNTGAVCRFAEFDFKRYGNDMKMESSFINFKQNHPKWVGAEEGEELMQRLGRVKEEELEKSMRLGDTMLYSSQVLSMSQQLMQSQAINTALGVNFGGVRMPLPQENEFYWLEKLHQQGQLGESVISDTSDQSHSNDLTLSSVAV